MRRGILWSSIKWFKVTESRGYAGEELKEFEGIDTYKNDQLSSFLQRNEDVRRHKMIKALDLT